MHIASFIVYIKTVNIYVDIAKNVGARFNISNYEWERSLSIGKNKKVVGLMKDERWIRQKSNDRVTEFAVLRPKPYSCLKDDNDKNKKRKGIKKCVIKQFLKF